MYRALMGYLRNSESLATLEKEIDEAEALGDNSAAVLVCCILWQTVNNLVITDQKKEEIEKHIPV
jgi:hypothetical protein